MVAGERCAVFRKKAEIFKEGNNSPVITAAKSKALEVVLPAVPDVSRLYYYVSIREVSSTREQCNEPPPAILGQNKD